MKVCAAAGCGKPISPDLLMCLPHWRKVPKDIQAEVYATARKYRRIDVQSPKFGQTRNEYYAAVKKAVQAVGVPKGETP